ncbi:MAG: PKD domain-containing protein, partial [Myxococcaceae bacterium]|nr:PKD domain-containing protein [Myxococcaceae bacterium]
MKPSNGFLVAALVAVACGPGKTNQVTAKPTAAFKVTQSTVRPQVFAFDAADSTTNIGVIAKYKWLFGDEAAGAATSDVVSSGTSHAYKMTGTFTVTLVVEDETGTPSEPVTKEVTVASVNSAGPTARITVTPPNGQPNAQVTFDGSMSTPIDDLQSFEWDFGDMTPKVIGKDKSIVQHTFAMAGTFRVTLKVTDSLGQNATSEVQVPIGSTGPVAVCTYTPMTGITQGSVVTFNGNNSTAPMGTTIIAHQWFPGDPGSDAGTGNPFPYAYRSMGTFQPKLKVFDSMGRSHETFCADVT